MTRIDFQSGQKIGRFRGKSSLNVRVHFHSAKANVTSYHPLSLQRCQVRIRSVKINLLIENLLVPNLSEIIDKNYFNLIT